MMTSLQALLVYMLMLWKLSCLELCFYTVLGFSLLKSLRVMENTSELMQRAYRKLLSLVKSTTVL